MTWGALSIIPTDRPTTVILAWKNGTESNLDFVNKSVAYNSREVINCFYSLLTCSDILIQMGFSKHTLVCRTQSLHKGDTKPVLKK